MSIFITLIAALIVFSAVIAIHEFGHFAVAALRHSGQRVFHRHGSGSVEEDL